MTLMVINDRSILTQAVDRLVIRPTMLDTRFTCDSHGGQRVPTKGVLIKATID